MTHIAIDEELDGKHPLFEVDRVCANASLCAPMKS
jgi:hypothetical protein